MRFGTDGVRGLANRDLTPESVLALGRAIGQVIGSGSVLIGRDTRRSGAMLQGALSAGLASMGRDVITLGVTSTPALAWWGVRDDCAAVMLSASHNPYADNGIKVFAPGGRKLTDDEQVAVESAWQRMSERPDGETDQPTGSEVGAVTEHSDPHTDYVDWLVSVLDGRNLSGLHVVVDGAHGSAFEIGPAAFLRAGATIDVIGDQPDGTNINEGCGSTDMAALRAAVAARGADFGVAFDGDADRMLAIDDRGGFVDGDRLLALFATDHRDRGRLVDDTVVITVMANLGFRVAMRDAGIDVVETPVGDRHVLAALDANGWSLGGEQSGHLIFHDLATTGDGVLAALGLADLVKRSGRPLSELSDAAMTSVPQVLVNVPVAAVGAPPPAAVSGAVADAEKRLGERGRILVRPSGTEPLLRIMVESIDGDADAIAASLAEVARAAL